MAGGLLLVNEGEEQTMVRYMTDGETAAVFFCDNCGKVLTKKDPGEVFFPDYEQFLEDLELGQDDASQCHFLCLGCYGKEQEDKREKM